MTHSTGQVSLLRSVGTGDLSVPEGRIIIIFTLDSIWSRGISIDLTYWVYLASDLLYRATRCSIVWTPTCLCHDGSFCQSITVNSPPSVTSSLTGRTLSACWPTPPSATVPCPGRPYLWKSSKEVSCISFCFSPYWSEKIDTNSVGFR